MRFVLSDVDYALMEYYRYASRILRNGRVRAVKFYAPSAVPRARETDFFRPDRVIKGEKLDSNSERYLFDPPAIWISGQALSLGIVSG